MRQLWCTSQGTGTYQEAATCSYVRLCLCWYLMTVYLQCTASIAHQVCACTRLPYLRSALARKWWAGDISPHQYMGKALAGPLLGACHMCPLCRIFAMRWACAPSEVSGEVIRLLKSRRLSATHQARAISKTSKSTHLAWSEEITQQQTYWQSHRRQISHQVPPMAFMTMPSTFIAWNSTPPSRKNPSRVETTPCMGGDACGSLPHMLQEKAAGGR